MGPGWICVGVRWGCQGGWGSRSCRWFISKSARKRLHRRVERQEPCSTCCKRWGREGGGRRRGRGGGLSGLLLQVSITRNDTALLVHSGCKVGALTTLHAYQASCTVAVYRKVACPLADGTGRDPLMWPSTQKVTMVRLSNLGFKDTGISTAASARVQGG